MTHKRQIVYHRDEDKFVIKDSFEGDGEHETALHWQIPPGVSLSVEEKGVAITNGKASAQLGFSGNHPFQIKTDKGEKGPISGWYSENYGNLEPAYTVQVVTKASLPIHYETVIKIK